MTVEQVDYLESNASLLAALDLALYNIAAAGIKIAGSGVLSEKFNRFLDKLKGSKESQKINIPENARLVANAVKLRNGTPLPGYKGGRIYNNQPINGGQKLPEGIIYKEYDIKPYIKGQNRGTERIVIGDDGSVWYTDDHYQTFTKID